MILQKQDNLRQIERKQLIIRYLTYNEPLYTFNFMHETRLIKNDPTVRHSHNNLYKYRAKITYNLYLFENIFKPFQIRLKMRYQIPLSLV